MAPSAGSQVVILLGAGAGADAGMPLVAQLTPVLYQEIVHLADDPPAMAAYLDATQVRFPETRSNFERMFARIAINADRLWPAPFTRAEAMKTVSDFIGKTPFAVTNALSRYAPSDASYLRHLVSPLGNEVRRIFTLNFDTLLEDVCEAHGVTTCTGFDSTGTWNGSLLDAHHGVLVYKLHGSVSWTTRYGQLREERRVSQRGLRKPELVLGPDKQWRDGSPASEAFRHLLACFSGELARSILCIVIGFAWADSHVASLLDRARRNGLAIVDVGPEPQGHKYLTTLENYTPRRGRACDVLKSGFIERCMMNRA